MIQRQGPTFQHVRRRTVWSGGLCTYATIHQSVSFYSNIIADGHVLIRRRGRGCWWRPTNHERPNDWIFPWKSIPGRQYWRSLSCIVAPKMKSLNRASWEMWFYIEMVELRQRTWADGQINIAHKLLRNWQTFSKARENTLIDSGPSPRASIYSLADPFLVSASVGIGLAEKEIGDTRTKQQTRKLWLHT